MRTIYYLNLGSNLGNPKANLEKGVERLRREFGAEGSSFEVSSFVESDPWGFDSPNRFVNVGVRVESMLEPIEMLRFTQRLERELGSGPHRDADGGYSDRLIDIDIMAASREGEWLEVNTPELTLPHAHLHERDFFLLPLKELIGRALKNSI